MTKERCKWRRRDDKRIMIGGRKEVGEEEKQTRGKKPGKQ